jgi:hypothetical protein
MKTYLSGCAALGVAAGFLVGASSSPVVQYVLPLLFAVLGAATGLLSLTMKSDSADARARFRLVGASLLALILPFLGAATYAALIRTNRPLSDLIPSLTAHAQAPLIDPADRVMLSPDDTIQILVYDRKLRLLGINDLEIDMVRSGIVERLADANRYMVENRAVLESATAELESNLNSQPAETASDAQIQSLMTEFANYRIGTKAPLSIPNGIERRALLSILSNLRGILDSSTDLTKTVRGNPLIMANVTKLTALLVPIEGTSIIDESANEVLTKGLEQLSNAGSASKPSAQGFFAISD